MCTEDCSMPMTVGGGLAGFALWMVMLEGPKMKGIIFRKNDKGEYTFTPENVIEYIKSPFKYPFFWTYKEFWQNNWIIMTAGGAAVGYMLSKFPL